MNNQHATVYIDEAGDLGANRGTRWFVLTAVIVNDEDEKDIRNRLNIIRSRLNKREIHMRNTHDFHQRAYIVREIQGERFVYMNVIVDTAMLDVRKIPSPIIAYNYVCKYLLQRVSWYLSDIKRTADIVLSSRGTSRDGELIEYIQNKLFPYKYNGIVSNVFKKVKAKASSSWEMLQLADICATTMFWSYEIHAFGFCIPCFSMALQKHLYRKNRKVISYGIKFFTPEMKPNIEELHALRICGQNCNKKERIPGTTTTCEHAGY